MQKQNDVLAYSTFFFSYDGRDFLLFFKNYVSRVIAPPPMFVVIAWLLYTSYNHTKVEFRREKETCPSFCVHLVY